MSVVFRAEDEPPATRFEYWHHVISDQFGAVEMREPDTGEFRDRLRVCELGPVEVHDLFVEHPESEGVRTRRHIGRTGGEACMISVQTRGRSVVEQNGRQAVLQPGDLTVVDLAQPCRFAGGPFGLTDILFPRTLFPLQADDLRRVSAVRVPGDRGAAAIASSLARRLPAHVDETGGADAARLGTAVLDLLTVAVAGHVGRDRDVPAETRGRALVPLARGFIEQHLADPGLSPATVAAAHFVSVRYLHKLFEAEDTTVADLIRRRRLERCRRDLLDPTLRSTTVAAIAARWGLPDPAHFGRLFRATYGVSPGRYRALAGGAPGR